MSKTDWRRLLILSVPFLALIVSGSESIQASDTEIVEEPIDTSQELVEVAMRYGLRGDEKYRKLVLKAAIRENPNNETARWAIGQIKLGDTWRSVTDLNYKYELDPALTEYKKLRAESLDTVANELKLARWCDRNDQDELSKLHYRRVLDHADANNSQRKAAIDRLGLESFGGRLLTTAEIDTIRADHRLAQRDLQHWTGKLLRWRNQLAAGTPRQQQKAFAELKIEVDASAIPAIELHFSLRNAKLASTAVSLLSEIDSPLAAQSLARHAVVPEWENVREEAIVELKKRPLHEFMPVLLNALNQPMKTVFRIASGSSGRVIHEHMVMTEGSEEKYIHRLQAVGTPTLSPRDTSGVATAQLRVAQQARNRARQIEQQVAQRNRQAEQQNARAYEVLESLTHHSEASATAWWDWWKDYNDIERPDQKRLTTLAYNESYGYEPDMEFGSPTSGTGRRSCECFPAGTLVWTQSGRVPIEKIRAGDRVLARHAESGEIALKLVEDVTLREKTQLLKLFVGDSAANTQLTATKGHPLWVEGSGWRMSKLVRVGDRVHTLNGSQAVTRIEEANSANAYNLVVADFATYFVTETGILVHDNSYRKPTRMLTPGFQIAAKP